MAVLCLVFCLVVVFFFKQKTAYEMRISDWSSDVCSSDLHACQDHRSDSAAPWRAQGEGRRQQNHGGEQHRHSQQAIELEAVRRGREAGRLHQLDEARQAPEGDGLGRREALLNLVHRQIGRQLEAVMEERALAGMRQPGIERSEEHTSELQSLMRISYAVFCLKKK